MNRRDTLTRAIDAVDRRPKDYGPPEQNFDRIARRWNVHIENRYRGREDELALDATDVAIMCADLKLARLEANPDHEDSWVDLAGYAACGAEVSTSSDEGVFVGDELGLAAAPSMGMGIDGGLKSWWRNAAADEAATTKAEKAKPTFKVGDLVRPYAASDFVGTVVFVGPTVSRVQFGDYSVGSYENDAIVPV